MMNEITNFLQESDIEANLISDYFGSRIEFRIVDCFFSVLLKKDMTLDDFKAEINNQYLNHIKRQADLHKSLADIYIKQIENYKPILN